MSGLPAGALDRLREVVDLPDLAGTRYEVIRRIGRGGMGAVYEAEDRILARSVAIKVLAAELSSPEAAQRMEREAKVIASLEHPAIIPIHDLGTLPDGRVFYAMKLVKGESLDRFAENLSVADRLRLFLRLCEGVAFAHARGVIHCDLKPSNVLVGEFGEVVVMDWGLASTERRDAPAGGTRGFMAPEQTCGGPVDARADVFALGCILRELVPARPRALAAIVRSSTAPAPADRIPDAGLLAADIVRYLDGEPLRCYREAWWERIARFVRKNAALIAVVAAYLLMRAAIFLWTSR